MSESIRYKLTNEGDRVLLIELDQIVCFRSSKSNKYTERYNQWLAEGNTPLPADSE